MIAESVLQPRFHAWLLGSFAGLAAAYVPARRAARVDPISAIRAD